MSKRPHCWGDKSSFQPSTILGSLGLVCKVTKDHPAKVRLDALRAVYKAQRDHIYAGLSDPDQHRTAFLRFGPRFISGFDPFGGA